MRLLARFVSLLLLASCAVIAPPPPAPPAPQPAAEPQPYGFTVAEEARILEMEDKREWDADLVSQWLHHENPLHRRRIALALGRIGPHVNHGATELASLVTDPDSTVRAAAAFSLGQIADAASADALVQFANDADGDVAAEAVEALAKLGAKLPLARYSPFTAAEVREGVRARAIRFLFRFRSDDASAIAAAALESPSAVIRQEAAYALARRPLASARAKLELLTSDPNILTRSYAVGAIGRIADPQSLPIVLNAMRDPHPWMRTNAVIALARLATKEPKSIERPQSADDVLLVVDLTNDPDPGTRASSIDALGWYARTSDRARKRLLDLATSGSRWVRELAAGAIAKHLGDEKLLPADITGWSKVRVLEAAAPISDRVRAAYAKDSDAMVRAQALATIADDKVAANADLIRTGLDDADVVVRGYSTERYSHLSEPGKLAKLQAAETRARGDQQNDARISAVRALADFEWPEREAFLRGLLADRDTVIRRIAADLIEQKLKQPRPSFTPLAVPARDYTAIVQWSRTPHTATIKLARGAIRVALLTQEAPMTTWNFAQLAGAHYFDNSSFMRVVPNFVIQGGDPRNDMEGGPGYAIRDEMNLQKYTRGAVGMALSGPDTGGSQYFITHSPQPHLDGGYTIFGRVTDGMTAVVDQVERGDKVETITIDR
jgi:cyclophilin family peptidyl-prolyl cis-trans isomerase/HEAT repeat protein